MSCITVYLKKKKNWLFFIILCSELNNRRNLHKNQQKLAAVRQLFVYFLLKNLNFKAWQFSRLCQTFWCLFFFKKAKENATCLGFFQIFIIINNQHIYFRFFYQNFVFLINFYVFLFFFFLIIVYNLITFMLIAFIVFIYKFLFSRNYSLLFFKFLFYVNFFSSYVRKP